MNGLFSTFVLAMIGMPLWADDATLGPVVVHDAYAFATPANGRSGAGYMVIENQGEEPVVLIASSSEAQITMIHETVQVGDLIEMRHRMSVQIAPGEAVVFEPGGLHVMFMGIAEPFVAGADIPATLNFGELGALEVTFRVRNRGE